MSNHIHNWQFAKLHHFSEHTMDGVRFPALDQATFVCECGAIKTVEVKPQEPKQ